MAACPSGKYADVLRTPSGLTLTDPVGLISTEYDYNEWHAKATSVLENAGRSWERLKGAIREPVPAEYNLLVSEINRIRKAMHDSPTPWPTAIAWMGNIFTSTEVERMAALASDAACLWQRIDELSTTIGIKPIGPADKPPKEMSILETLAVITGATVLVVGGVMLVKAVAK